MLVFKEESDDFEKAVGGSIKKGGSIDYKSQKDKKNTSVRAKKDIENLKKRMAVAKQNQTDLAKIDSIRQQITSLRQKIKDIKDMIAKRKEQAKKD